MTPSAPHDKPSGPEHSATFHDSPSTGFPPADSLFVMQRYSQVKAALARVICSQTGLPESPEVIRYLEDNGYLRALAACLSSTPRTDLETPSDPDLRLPVLTSITAISCSAKTFTATSGPTLQSTFRNWRKQSRIRRLRWYGSTRYSGLLDQLWTHTKIPTFVPYWRHSREYWIRVIGAKAAPPC
jgi:hypothetical protein